MSYRITGLPIEEFAGFLSKSPEELRALNITVCVADAPASYPCRITLEDAEPGEELLLLNYAHLTGATPYASSGPIFIRRNAAGTRTVTDDIPEQQRRRLLSVRAYDRAHFMLDAEVVEGTGLESLIERFFTDGKVAYLHVHNARRGCYACRVDRA
jgi:hypothetical protein